MKMSIDKIKEHSFSKWVGWITGIFVVMLGIYASVKQMSDDAKTLQVSFRNAIELIQIDYKNFKFDSIYQANHLISASERGYKYDVQSNYRQKSKGDFYFIEPDSTNRVRIPTLSYEFLFSNATNSNTSIHSIWLEIINCKNNSLKSFHYSVDNKLDIPIDVEKGKSIIKRIEFAYEPFPSNKAVLKEINNPHRECKYRILLHYLDTENENHEVELKFSNLK